MIRKRWLVALTSNLVLFTGCGEWMLTKRIPAEKVRPAVQQDSEIALKNLCDVDRIRTRNELLTRLEAEKFRQLALKISQNVNRSDIEDLKRLDQTRRLGHDLDPEIKRRRSELIQEIYQNATVRAGFTPGQKEALEKTNFSYVVSVDPVSSDIDRYVNLLVGTFSSGTTPSPSPSGQPATVTAPSGISGVTVGVSPDQSRFRIGLLRVYRYDPQPDGTQIGRSESITLWEQIEETIPRRCQGSPTGLNQEEFDTLPGLQP